MKSTDGSLIVYSDDLILLDVYTRLQTVVTSQRSRPQIAAWTGSRGGRLCFANLQVKILRVNANSGA